MGVFGEQIMKYQKRCIFGYVGQKNNVFLISRRCYKNLGVRFFNRGTDKEGNASNFVETEQILKLNGNFYSSLQVRGSISMKWSQQPTFAYMPEIKIFEDNSIEKHNEILKRKYKEPFYVNLIKTKGNEKDIYN